MVSIKLRFYQILICFCILWISGNNVAAQDLQKKIYTSNLDSLWSRSTYIEKMTTDGKWIVFKEVFDFKSSVLFLKHASDTITFKFTDSQWVRISNNNNWFSCITQNKELNLINLVKHTKEIYPNVQSYAYSNSSQFIATFQEESINRGRLNIKNLNDNSDFSIQGVNKYIWHPKQNRLLLSINDKSNNKLVLCNAENLSLNVLKENSNSHYNHLQWSNSGNAVLFSEQVNNINYLNYYSLNGTLKTLDDDVLESKFPHYKISSKSVFISNNGKRILFYRQPKKEVLSDDLQTMEVWDSEVPWIYPKMKNYTEREQEQLLTAWYPETNDLIAIETPERPTAALDVNHDYAIVYDKLQYEPMYKEFPITDIYIKDLNSGYEYLIVEKQYTESGFVTISPLGKYIAYFQNNHWWVYDIIKNQKINLTKELNIPFQNIERDRAGYLFPYGNPGWSENDEFIFLYDQYDIWLMSSDGKYKERITDGRKDNIKYRISKDYYRNNYYFLTVNTSFASSPFNLNKELVFELQDDLHNTGYAIWKRGKKIKKLFLEERKADQVLVSDDFKNLFFKKQKFNESPGIYNINLKNNKQQLIYQSNKELLNYDLGKAKLINYEVNEKMLSGVLIYPANFNPEKKYPMIVNVYEKSSGNVNIFNPPSIYDFIGFNTLKYITNDYFLLYPNISYSIGNPGGSALNCVTSAINKALESGYISESKIGLIGHSFGGYQSAFIATQSDKFAAIVSGAAVTDFTSHYHSVGWNWNEPEMWRYESQQWRMGDSYYNIKDAYLCNSPLHHVENVKTPLLLWTGKIDFQIHWTQSVKMFLALKRLNKKSKLLLFDNEAHVVRGKENQKKLSNEIFEWFEIYCK